MISTDTQMEAEDAIVLAGGGYAICRSVDEVKARLGDWGVL